MPFRLSVAVKVARSTYRCVWTAYSVPRSLRGTQPVELFGRIGSRMWYQVWFEPVTTAPSTSTMFWVPSLVIVGSVVIAEAVELGCERAIAGVATTAQCAILSFVRVYE